MSEIFEQKNKDKKWNESEYYFLIKNIKLKTKDGYETTINIALTETELIRAIERAKKNPEDFEEISESFLEKIKDFFD